MLLQTLFSSNSAHSLSNCSGCPFFLLGSTSRIVSALESCPVVRIFLPLGLISRQLIPLRKNSSPGKETAPPLITLVASCKPLLSSFFDIVLKNSTGLPSILLLTTISDSDLPAFHRSRTNKQLFDVVNSRYIPSGETSTWVTCSTSVGQTVILVLAGMPLHPFILQQSIFVITVWSAALYFIKAWSISPICWPSITVVTHFDVLMFFLVLTPFCPLLSGFLASILLAICFAVLQFLCNVSNRSV